MDLSRVPLVCAANGEAVWISRGCGNSYVSLSAPELWPEQARTWYDLYTKHFWQEVWTGAGFREFPIGMPGYDWYIDVDSGPVIKGYGFAACAFGVGAARVHGHMEHAYPLTAEMDATSWPIPGGMLLIPRLLSNAADAPLLGEAGILYCLTRQPIEGAHITYGGFIPLFTWIVLTIQIVLGVGLLIGGARSIWKWRTHRGSLTIPFPQIQFASWICLLLGCVVLLAFAKYPPAIALLLTTQLLPRGIREKAPN